MFTQHIFLTPKCECEHESHFVPASESNSPKGHITHSYGVQVTQIIPVATPFGTFHVCKECASDCYADYVKQAENR